jgi:ribose transport system permease protein
MSDQTVKLSGAAGVGGKEPRATRQGVDSSVIRVAGLVLALAGLVAIGGVTSPDTFLDIDNATNILRVSAAIGVVAIGMTFVITGGGIDLSVGAIVALSSVWCTTLATKDVAESTHWSVIVLTAVLVGTGCGLVNGVLIAYGKVVAFMTTLAMLAAARGLAEVMSDRRTQNVANPDYVEFFRFEILGLQLMVWIFVLVAVLGWIAFNRTTFGRRTVAIGGNPEAARLAGINVQRHTTMLYVLLGSLSGLAAAMVVARTTTGTSTHGLQYELDAIAAVVIGGTLLSGGRGTIFGTVIGVLIFGVLQAIFTQNNLTTSSQAIAKGAIIVAAVLLQQRVARSSNTS